ncbi:amidohydrolase [Caenimonas sedimenti]|uniref:Amidohydrolase n=1 Tax=Caenimonas sedimenti TaxID=2596921 RepID=A0A562ZWD4_9BURK|nr:amidohydrolase family protein [Caenimonas sedimenti]TWO72929.1 amidohydrolase [Caenimonas sedimenti]
MLFHRCAVHGARCAAVPEDGAASGSRGQRFFTIDLHCHALSPEVEKLVATHPRRQAEPEMMVRTLGAESAAHNARVMLPAAGPKLTGLDARLADMDAMGVDVQVVSPSPNQYYYWADDALARDVVRVQNEHIAALCAKHPDRLQGLGTVALQQPQLAVEQLRHAVEVLGLRGVEISTTVEGRELADEAFEPFWAEAARLRCVVFLHPLGTWAFERLNRWYLTNVIGQPLETTVALSHIIFSGLLDRHPGLRLLAAHGGGYLPAYLGRFEHAWKVRPEAKSMLRPPRDYLRRIWFDTVVYEPMAIRRLIDEVGITQLVTGTDYPFDMGSYDIAGLLAQVPGLDDAGRTAILGGNARRLLDASQA